MTTTDVSFTKGKLMFPCFKEKSAKRWLEVAFDLMRGPRVAQIANTSRIYIILRAQRVPTGWFLGPSKAPASERSFTEGKLGFRVFCRPVID